MDNKLKQELSLINQLASGTLYRNQEMLKLHKDGMSLAEIGRKFKISRQRVFQLILRQAQDK